MAAPKQTTAPVVEPTPANPYVIFVKDDKYHLARKTSLTPDPKVMIIAESATQDNAQAVLDALNKANKKNWLKRLFQ